MPYADPEKKREQMRAWRAANPDKVKEYSRRGAPRQKIYYQENKGHYAELRREYRYRHPQETLVAQAQSRAKRDGLPCDITAATLEWPTHCPVLGVEISYTKNNKDNGVRSNSATLDRRINELGYVVGNVFVLSHRANRIKSDATLAELEAVVRYMKENSHESAPGRPGLATRELPGVDGEKEGQVDEAGHPS